MVTAENFSAGCEEYGVILDRHIFPDGTSPTAYWRYRQYYNTYNPRSEGNIYEAIIVASDRHELDPEQALANKPIPQDALQENARRSTAAALLARIINASLTTERSNSAPIDATPLPEERCDLRDSCADAENNFARMFRRMKRPDSLQNNESLDVTEAVIITMPNDNNEPLFVIKTGFGIESAILLHDAYKKGVVYPAGSIFSCNIEPSISEITKDKRYKTVGYQALKSARFVRLSTYAIEPTKRQQEFDVPDRTADALERAILREASISYLCELTKKAMTSSFERRRSFSIIPFGWLKRRWS